MRWFRCDCSGSWDEKTQLCSPSSLACCWGKDVWNDKTHKSEEPVSMSTKRVSFPIVISLTNSVSYSSGVTLTVPLAKEPPCLLMRETAGGRGLWCFLRPLHSSFGGQSDLMVFMSLCSIVKWPVVARLLVGRARVRVKKLRKIVNAVKRWECSIMNCNSEKKNERRIQWYCGIHRELRSSNSIHINQLQIHDISRG